MITKHFKFPLNTTSHGFGEYCWKKINRKLLLMCPDSGVIKHMIMHLDEHEGHPLP